MRILQALAASVGRREPDIPPDNSAKECRPLDVREEHGGLTLYGTCSLCGAAITLWPATEGRCPRCRARVDHLCGD